MRITREDLTAFLSQRLGVDAQELDGNTGLVSDGLLDSVSVVDLVLFVEEKAEIEFDPVDVRADNFDSVERIIACVEAARNGKAE